MAFTKRHLVLICFLLIGSLTGRADHPPEDQIAREASEQSLGNINVNRDHIVDVVKKLGEPSNVDEKTSADYPTGSGARSYEWSHRGVRLSVGTEFYTDKKTGNLVESKAFVIDTWGKRDDRRLGCTGKGLCIGDDLVRVKKLYGRRFQTDPHGLRIQWADGTLLT